MLCVKTTWNKSWHAKKLAFKVAEGESSKCVFCSFLNIIFFNYQERKQGNTKRFFINTFLNKKENIEKKKNKEQNILYLQIINYLFYKPSTPNRSS